MYGQKSVGKSLCLKEFNRTSSEWLKSVTVCASECYTNRILFESIINKLNDHKLSHEDSYESFAKVESMEEFLVQLSALDPAGSYLISIENAEKIRDMDHNMFPVFTKLREFTGINISCILISHLAYEKFRAGDVIKLHVPDYSKNEIIEIFLSKHKELHMKIINTIYENESNDNDSKFHQLAAIESMDAEFYKNYLNIFLNVFYKACRDIKELEYLSDKCYQSYYAPIMNGEIRATDITSLWRHSMKSLKQSLKTTYMRIDNMPTFEDTKRDESTTTNNESCSSIQAFAMNLELPFYAKYLLIASFLASHNDAKTDKRLFMKYHGKERKRQKKAKVNYYWELHPSFIFHKRLILFFRYLKG